MGKSLRWLAGRRQAEGEAGEVRLVLRRLVRLVLLQVVVVEAVEAAGARTRTRKISRNRRVAWAFRCRFCH